MAIPQLLESSSAQSPPSLSPLSNFEAVDTVFVEGHNVKRYIGEFWTSRQRQAASIHEVSYRACFKPQLPRFFIELLTAPGDVVYDPFSGRGTTAIEAGLLGRRVIANDINPLSKILTQPRFSIPDLQKLKERLSSIPFRRAARAAIDLSMFFHRDTEAEIVSIREYLRKRSSARKEDSLDRWIRMVATNRLTGHSKGFFSAYTLPPNQAVTQEQQVKINRKLRQKPPYRDTRAIILKKTTSLLRNLIAPERENLECSRATAKFLHSDARKTRRVEDESVRLTVTSPPFLDVVDYRSDNWLRCWFNDIDERETDGKITSARTVEEWSDFMRGVFRELHRVTQRGGWLAFEVGEVRNGSIRLDEVVLPLGTAAGFNCEGILVNTQSFTKTSNIWGIRNNTKGTNTNRIVLFQRRKH